MQAFGRSFKNLEGSDSLDICKNENGTSSTFKSFARYQAFLSRLRTSGILPSKTEIFFVDQLTGMQYFIRASLANQWNQCISQLRSTYLVFYSMQNAMECIQGAAFQSIWYGNYVSQLKLICAGATEQNFISILFFNINTKNTDQLGWRDDLAITSTLMEANKLL